MWRAVFLAFLFNNAGVSSGANILFYFGVGTYSHRTSVWPLVEALAERGHNVTFLSSFPPKEPNPKVHEVVITNSLKLDINFVELRMNRTYQHVWLALPQIGTSNCEAVTSNKDIRRWSENAQFDLVIIDTLYNECGLGLAYKFKAPHILFGTTSAYMWHSEMFGYSPETSWVPDMQLAPRPKQMNFYQRIRNTISPIFWTFYRHWMYYPRLEEIVRTGFNIRDMPPLTTLERQAQLLLINSHYSLDFPRSFPQFVVPVGGLQCKNTSKPLPPNFQKFIEGSGESGFIYVSLGSSAKSADFPESIRKMFFQAFTKAAPVRIIWKWESEVPADMPSNVLTSEWMPQQDILAHPKLRAYITHSGLLSTQEAAYHGVPIITFPVFAEQDYNAGLLEIREYGVRLELQELTLEKLQTAIDEILNNPKYKQNMKEVSSLLRDRLVNPVDAAVWWVEHVIKYPRISEYLRPFGSEQTWYERRELDVWGFILLLLLLTVWLTGKVVGKLFRRSNSNVATKSSQRKKNS